MSKSIKLAIALLLGLSAPAMAQDIKVGTIFPLERWRGTGRSIRHQRRQAGGPGDQRQGWPARTQDRTGLEG